MNKNPASAVGRFKEINMKYEITDIEHPEYKQLRRIRALIDIGTDVKAGDLGGYVESAYNLSQYGDCWLYDDSRMFDHSRMRGNSQMHDHSLMLDYSIMLDNSRMHDNSMMLDYSRMFDYSHMHGNSRMHDHSEMRDYSQMHGNSRMHDNSWMKCISYSALAIALFFTAMTAGIWYVEGELDFWLALIFGG